MIRGRDDGPPASLQKIPRFPPKWGVHCEALGKSRWAKDLAGSCGVDSGRNGTRRNSKRRINSAKNHKFVNVLAHLDHFRGKLKARVRQAHLLSQPTIPFFWFVFAVAFWSRQRQWYFYTLSPIAEVPEPLGPSFVLPRNCLDVAVERGVFRIRSKRPIAAQSFCVPGEDPYEVREL